MEKDEKKVWKPAEIAEVGHVAEVIQGGEGKLSPVGSDPGESRKVQPDELV
jgi:hypothetical protein